MYFGEEVPIYVVDNGVIISDHLRDINISKLCEVLKDIKNFGKKHINLRLSVPLYQLMLSEINAYTVTKN